MKDCFHVDPEALPCLGGRERPASFGVAQHESAERLLASFEIDIGQARRRHDTERIAIAAGVLGGDQALLAGDPHPQRAPLGFEHGSLRLVELADAEIPPQPQQIVQLVGIPRVAAQLRLHLLDCVRVKQLAQLLLPQQLPQQLAVERQRLRPPLGRRRVVLVHVSGDVVEEQRGRIGRRGRRLDVDEVELPRPQSLQQPLQRRQVEDVLQALAVGLEDDRESRVLPRHLEQRLGLQSLLPERRPLIRSPARDQQRPRGVLAEACAEERRVADFVDDQLLDLLGIDQDEVARRRRVGVGQMDRDPVVRPDRVGVEPERLANAGRERQPPGRVHPGAERRQDAEPPVADLVTETLDHDRPVGWKRARSRSLLAQELEQVLRGALVEGMLLAQLRLRLPVRQSRQLTRDRSYRLAELVGPPHPLAAPERHRTRHAGSRRDEHSVARDLLDPPARGAEQERLAGSRLVDHLLVELSDPAAAVHQVDAEEAAVGNRARVGDCEPSCALASADDAARAVPDDPRTELCKLIRGVTPREHVEHVL